MITIKELSKRLNKSIRTIQLWVANEKITPVNYDTHKRDGGYVFSEEEVKRVESLYVGLSSKQAAGIVGVTPQYLNELALAGRIESDLRQVGRREQRFYKLDACLQLKQILAADEHRKTSQFGRKLPCYKNQVRLFAELEYEGRKSLIVDTDPPSIMYEDGRVKVAKNLKAMESCPEVSYQTRKGFIDFRFPIPRSISHQLYSVLRTLITHIGAKNVQVFETKDGDYYVRCRSGSMPNINQGDYDFMAKHRVIGKIEVQNEHILLTSEIISRYVSFDESAYRVIEEVAERKKLNFDTALNDIIRFYSEDDSHG